MALGGGTFVTQNKVLPGSYINFVSAATANASLSDRGFVAMPMELDWGPSGIITLTSEDAIKNLKTIFGYDYTDSEMADIRDIFKNARVLYTYRLNGAGVKASNTYCTAVYAGVRGNDLKTVIEVSIEDSDLFDVKTFLGAEMVDKQTVEEYADLVANDFVVFDNTATLEATAGTALTGGTNSTVTGSSYSAFLAAAESYTFNALATKSDDSSVKALFVAFTKRMRDEMGIKFQTILYNYSSADYEGVISTPNTADAIPWLLGAQGGCNVNASCTNKLYDGEATVTAEYTQAQLETFILNGQLAFHKVGDDIRILTDINTLKTTTADKGDLFKNNQSIRVMDQIANDIAVVFNTSYLGVCPNNNSGRANLQADIVAHHKELMNLGAIEDFKGSDVSVEQGNSKTSVVVTDEVTIVNAMEKLYMTVVVD